MLVGLKRLRCDIREREVVESESGHVASEQM